MMKMKGARIILEMLKLHGIRHVFGLPGETTLALYREWCGCSGIEHILTHDERAAAYMAEAYAKVTGTVGVTEAPSPGGAHPAPGVLESFTGGIPTICFTSDVHFNYDKRNMLSGFDQNGLYSAITKESLLVTTAKDLPFLIRRAFRIAVSDKPGAVHIRVPMNIYDEEADVRDMFPDPCMAQWPAFRPVADFKEIEKAITILSEAERPLIVCGQGALVSSAGKEVLILAEALQIPVACTMTAKGTIHETHPLSIRLIGARGGTGYSNAFLEKADAVFFIGSNTDSAGTDAWRLPDCKSCCDKKVKIISLNISGADVSNVYRTDVALLGDAKATVAFMNARIEQLNVKGRAINAQEVESAMLALDASIDAAANDNKIPVNPVRFMKALQKILPDNSFVIVEPGVGSIFSAAYFVQKKMGRQFLSNYSNGALGYALPALVGVATAHPQSLVIGLGGDGSFHFNCGELETYARLNINAKMIIFNNDVFGWIKGEIAHVYKAPFFATDFGRVDYAGVAKAFGIKGFKIERPEQIEVVLNEAFSFYGPALIEICVPDESQLVPPIPRWIPNAKKCKIPYYY